MSLEICVDAAQVWQVMCHDHRLTWEWLCEPLGQPGACPSMKLVCLLGVQQAAFMANNREVRHRLLCVPVCESARKQRLFNSKVGPQRCAEESHTVDHGLIILEQVDIEPLRLVERALEHALISSVVE